MKSWQLASMCLLVLPSYPPALINRPLCLFSRGRCSWAATSVGSPSPTAARRCLTRAAASASTGSAARPPNPKWRVALAAGSRCPAVPSASWTWGHRCPTAQVKSPVCQQMLSWLTTNRKPLWAAGEAIIPNYTYAGEDTWTLIHMYLRVSGQQPIIALIPLIPARFYWLLILTRGWIFILFVQEQGSRTRRWTWRGRTSWPSSTTGSPGVTTVATAATRATCSAGSGATPTRVDVVNCCGLSSDSETKTPPRP